MSELEDVAGVFDSTTGMFELIKGVEGHVMLVPRRVTAFHIGKIGAHLGEDTNANQALRKSLTTDYSTLRKYIWMAPTPQEFNSRVAEVTRDIIAINACGSYSDASAVLAGAMSVEKIKKMQEVVCANENLDNIENPLRKWHQGFKVKWTGPKTPDQIVGHPLPKKRPHPPFWEVFSGSSSDAAGPSPSSNATCPNPNSINRGGHQISFKIDDLDDKSNFQKLVECLLQNKNKVSLILIVGGIIYLYFAKLPFLKVNIDNN